MSEQSNSFKEKFQNWFWWAAPISLLADIIGIIAAFQAQNQAEITQQTDGAIYPISDPLAFGLIPVSDIKVITGILTVFVIMSMLYYSLQVSESRNDYWWLIASSFFSVFLGWLYLRLAFGDEWFLCGCLLPGLLLLAIIGSILEKW